MRLTIVARVLLTFGIAITNLAGALPISAAAQAQQCFPKTGQCVRGRFLDYWTANGGLARNGYPIAPERREILEDGKEYTLQYFERVRMEIHPEYAPPYDVLLGQFGRQIDIWATSLAEPFATLYRTNPQVRDQIGVPNTTDSSGNAGPLVATRPGAFLAFERGAMIYMAGDAGAPGRIQVLCGDPNSGTATIGPRLVLGLPDTWTPDQPEGGAPGPHPGTYEPKRGFGKVWPNYRDCLGYATSPDETSYVQIAQFFSRGFLVTLPDAAPIYALYTEVTAPNQYGGRYQRYALPGR